MISVHGLTKTYAATRAVDDLTFEVQPGQVTGFLGPNGAGKSTTMRLILGLERPTAGTVTVDGRPFTALRRPLFHVGALLDANAFHPDRTAYNHLRALALSNHIPRQRVDEVLDQVGLTEVARKRAGTFSLGMSQRLGIAAAMLGDPSVLLFDEPVNGLDPEGIHWARMFMRQLAAEGRTVFVSSHLMNEMALTADHLVVIGRGRLIADTDVESFISASRLSRVILQTPQLARMTELIDAAGGGCSPEPGAADRATVSGMTAPQVGDLAAAHGIPIHGLGVQEASLEDAFMAITRDSVEFRAEPVDPTAGIRG